MRVIFSQQRWCIRRRLKAYSTSTVRSISDVNFEKKPAYEKYRAGRGELFRVKLIYLCI